jgi:hypothetical protein
VLAAAVTPGLERGGHQDQFFLRAAAIDVVDDLVISRAATLRERIERATAIGGPDPPDAARTVDLGVVVRLHRRVRVDLGLAAGHLDHRAAVLEVRRDTTGDRAGLIVGAGVVEAGRDGGVDLDARRGADTRCSRRSRPRARRR